MRSRARGVFCATLVLVLGGASCGGSPVSPSAPEYRGVCAAAKESPYVLPYPVGVAYTVSQGYPPYIHSPLFKFAVDFSMASRSVVVAARDGEVEFIEQGYENDDSTGGHENVVVLAHGDGRFSRYAHLVKNGALVRVHDRVSRGQPIGLSGASGSSIPHLHFDVTTGCSYRDSCQTVPVCFSNTKAHPDGLQRGQSYRAEPY